MSGGQLYGHQGVGDQDAGKWVLLWVAASLGCRSMGWSAACLPGCWVCQGAGEWNFGQWPLLVCWARVWHWDWVKLGILGDVLKYK